MSDIVKQGAYKFGGANKDHIVFKNQSFDLNAGSFSFWIYVPEKLDNSSIIFRAGNKNVNKYDAPRTIGIDYFTSHYIINYSILVNVFGSNSVSTLYSSKSFEYNRWYHIVVTHDFDDTEINLNTLTTVVNFYINGSKDDNIGPTTTSYTTDIIHPSGFSSLGVGYLNGVLDNTSFFEGYITQFSVWGCILNEADSNALYNNCNPTPLNEHDKALFLLSWYKLNDAATYRKKREVSIFDPISGTRADLVRSGEFTVLSGSYRNYLYPSFVSMEDSVSNRTGINAKNGFVSLNVPESDYGFQLLNSADDKSEIEEDYSIATRNNVTILGSTDYASSDIYTDLYDNNAFSVGIFFRPSSIAGTKDTLIHRGTDNTNANTEYKIYVNSSNFVVFDLIDATTKSSNTVTSTVVVESDKTYAVVVRYNESTDEGNLDLYRVSDNSVISSVTGAALLSGDSMNLVSDKVDCIGKALPVAGSNELMICTVYDLFMVQDYISDENVLEYFSGTQIKNIVRNSEDLLDERLYCNITFDGVDGQSFVRDENYSVNGLYFDLYGGFAFTSFENACPRNLWFNGTSSYCLTKNYTDIRGSSFSFGVDMIAKVNTGTVAFVGANNTKGSNYEWYVYLTANGSNYDINFKVSDGTNEYNIKAEDMQLNERVRLFCSVDMILNRITVLSYDVDSGLVGVDFTSFPNTRYIYPNAPDFYLGATNNGSVTGFFSGVMYGAFFANEVIDVYESYSFIYTGQLGEKTETAFKWGFNEISGSQLNSSKGFGQHYINTALLEQP